MDDLDYKTQSSNIGLSSIGDLFSRAWQVYKERFWTLVGIMAIPVLAWLVIGGLGIGLTFLSSLFEGGILILMVLLVIVGVVMGILLAFWPQVALIYAIKERERRIGIKDCFVKGWRIISSFIWVSILVSLVTFGGFILLIIPGFIFAVWFLFSTYILVTENVNGSAALSRSKELVQGYWWSIFGRIALLILVAGGIGFILAFVPFVGQLISNLLVVPFSVTFLYLLYEDLKRAKGEVSPAGEERPSRPSTQKGISTKVIMGLAILGLVAMIGAPAAITMFALGGAREAAKDARITSEMGQLRSKAELINVEGGYNELSCGYDNETQSLCDDIEEYGGEVTIYSSEEEYCAYTLLNKGGYYCVDSTGVVNTTTELPASCGQGSYKCPRP